MYTYTYTILSMLILTLSQHSARAHVQSQITCKGLREICHISISTYVRGDTLTSVHVEDGRRDEGSRALQSN